MKTFFHWITATLGVAFYCAVRATASAQNPAPALSIEFVSSAAVRLSWPAVVADFVLEETGTLTGAPAWQAVAGVPQLQNAQFTVNVPLADAIRFYRLRQARVAPTFQVIRHTPLDGAVEVGVTYRPQIFFSQPVDSTTLTTDNFFAFAGGFAVEANIVPANDGTFAWLFFKQSLPGAGRVRITVDGSTIQAADGKTILDAASNGQPGSVLSFEFTTVSQTALPGTSLTGLVVDPGPDLIPRTADDVDPGADGIVNTLDDLLLLPIAGVKVYLLGRETDVITTGPNGRFHFDSVPVGDVKVVVDGRTASNPPAGMYFPEMVMDANMVAGVNNFTMLGMPVIYLPRLSKTILQAVSVSTNTTITTKPEGASGLTDAQRQQLTIEVPANSLIAADGSKLTTGQVGISTVPPELVRDMLPPGVLQHTFDITVQAPGIATFSTPAPVTFPNVFNAAPGMQLNFLSFDHTTGRLVIEGTATVSADGLSVHTDPGTGVTHPGWHGLTPPGGPGGPSNGPPAVCESAPDDSSLSVQSLASPVPQFPPKALPMIVGETGVLSDPALAWTGPPIGDSCGLKVEIQIDGPLEKFMKKSGNLPLKSQTFTLRPGSGKTKTFKGVAKTFDEMFGKGNVARFIEDELFGAKITVTTSLLHSSAPSDVTVRTFYLYRWVNVTYPDDFLSGTGGTVAFRKTLNDGTGNGSTIKSIIAVLPKTVATGFSVTPPPGAPKVFDVTRPFTNHQLQWEFDPPTAGTFTHPLDITMADGQNTVVGNLTLRGHGIDPTRINLDLPGYKAELKRVILNLRNVSAFTIPSPGFVFPVYAFSADATTLPAVVVRRSVSGPGGTLIPEDNLNFVPGGATNVLDGPDLILGTKDDVGYKRYTVVGNVFQSVVQGYMPDDRAVIGPDGIPGSPDDTFSVAQLSALDPLLDAEANSLLAAVTQQFNVVHLLPDAVQFVDTGGTINCQWIDVFVTLGNRRGYGTASPGMPVYGLGDIGQNKFILGNLLPNTKLPLGAKFWALAEYLNVNPTNQISVSVGINLDYRGPDTFAAFVANTVSHEIGHTLGLVDAYTDDGKVGTARCRPADHNCIPYDLMQNGQTTDPYLQFKGGNIGLLQAAVGVSGTHTGLTYSKNEAALLAELLQYRKTFNLGTSSTGIRENNPLDPPPTEPEISVFQENNSFFGEDDEKLEIEDQIAADGPGGDFIDVPFTILNSGYGPLAVSSIAFAAGTNGFTLVNATTILGQPITPGRSTNLILRFDPSVAGTVSDTLQIASDADAVPLLSIPITATASANAPTVQVELAGNNNFGGVSLGAAAVSMPDIFRVSNAGKTTLQITGISIIQGAGAFTLAGVPGNLASQPVQLAYGQSFSFGGSFSPDQAGLRRALIEIKTNDPQTPLVRVSFVGTGLNSPVEAEWGDDFVAIETPDLPALAPLRARSDAKGNFEFFLPSQEFYHLTVFDPVTGLIGHETDTTEPSGQRTLLVDTIVFAGSTEPDSDYDGLPDDIEFAIGTDPTKIDTDGDGIDDFTEVAQNQDPLGGHEVALGAGTKVDVGGEALQVVVLPNPSGTAQIAYVAADIGGLVMVDVTDPNQPVVLGRYQGRVDTTIGRARNFAVDPELQIAALVQSDPTFLAQGFFLIDVSDPASPQLLSSFPSPFSEVAVVDGYAYVHYGSDLRAIKLRTGVVEGHLQARLDGGPVTREGNYLYWSSVDGVTIIEVHGAEMKLHGSFRIPGDWNRFFVANSIFYAALHFNAQRIPGGYATFDVSDPDNPVLIADGAVPAGVSAPGAAFAATGSGLGLLVGVAPGIGGIGIQPPSNAVDLLDASNPTNTYKFITRFPLPEPPNDVTVSAGVGYIADGKASLVILKYAGLDTQGQPPVVSVKRIFPDADPATAGVQIVEGDRFSVQADVIDDGQVRTVELLVNGQVTDTGTSPPYNLQGTAPNIIGQSATFVVQVRATDTGGNVGVSAPVTVNLLRDTTLPQLLQTDPAEGDSKLLGTDTIRLVLSEPLASGSLIAANFEVIPDTGPTLRPLGFTLLDFGNEVDIKIAALEAGPYRLVLHSAAITDRAGHPLGTSEIVVHFTVLPYSIYWTHNAPGNWSWFNPTNWVPQRVPGPKDAVYIKAQVPDVRVFMRARNFPARQPSQLVRVRSLTSEEQLYLDGVDLHADEAIRVNNMFSLNGSKLSDTRVFAQPNTLLAANVDPSAIGGNIFVTFEGYGAVLNNVTLEGDFPIVSGDFNVVNRLTLNGNVIAADKQSAGPLTQYGAFVWQYGFLYLGDDAAVIDGSGTFHNFSLTVEANGGPGNLSLRPPFPISVLIDSNVTFRGILDVNILGDDEPATLINRGQFLADTNRISGANSDSVINIYPGKSEPGRPYLDVTNTFVNEGTIAAINGASLAIDGSGSGFPTLRTVLISRGILKSADTSFLFLGTDLMAKKITCEPGGFCKFASGRLITPQNQITELTGGGHWFANSPQRGVSTEFTGGTVRLTGGAALEGTLTFNNVTFEGDFHNYDWRARKNLFPTPPVGSFDYGGQIYIVSNLTLNGGIHFHSSSNWSGQLMFRNGIPNNSLDGRGQVEYEGINPFNQFDGDGEGITIGSSIVLHGQSLLIGNIGNLFQGYSTSLIVNQGTILTQPGDDLRIYALFTNSGTIHICTNCTVQVGYNFNQTATGKLEFDVAGTSAGTTYGQLKIGVAQDRNFGLGVASLDGAVNLNATPTYQPALGDSVELLDYQSLKGTFNSIHVPVLAPSLQWIPTYGNTNFQLRISTQSPPP